MQQSLPNHLLIQRDCCKFPAVWQPGGKYYICVDILSSGWAEVTIMTVVLLSKVISWYLNT